MTQRTAVVVGGASGIGKAVARALAADSCRVIVADRNADGARSVATELGDPHSAATAEVTDEDSVRALFDQAGALAVVANTAGYSTLGLLTQLPAEDFRSVVDVCLTGAFLVIKHAAPRLSKGGALVSISSLNGRQPAAAMSAYCAAKAGLSMLTEVAALELAPQGIRPHAADRTGRRGTRRHRGVSGEHRARPRRHPRGHRQRRAVPVFACLVVADR